MAGEEILIIEDEEDILELVRYNLARENYKVTCTSSGEEGLKALENKKPDLLILDLMLPQIDGLEVCKILKNKAETQNIPIIMLTAKGEEADIVTGLELGADDYITKPFSPRVLLARIRAVLRRRKPVVNDGLDINIHDIKIHPGRHEVLVGETPVELTNTEFRILHFLARKAGWVFTRYQIVDAVKGEDYFVTERTIDVHITMLRKKLGASGKLIETVRGVGYRLKE